MGNEHSCMLLMGLHIDTNVLGRIRNTYEGPKN